MTQDPEDPWINRDFERAVRETAYFLWEEGGRPFGKEQDYWFAALERCLRERQADEMLKASPPPE